MKNQNHMIWTYYILFLFCFHPCFKALKPFLSNPPLSRPRFSVKDYCWTVWTYLNPYIPWPRLSSSLWITNPRTHKGQQQAHSLVMCCLHRMSQSYFISSEKHCRITSLTLLHVVQPVKVYLIDFHYSCPFRYNLSISQQHSRRATMLFFRYSSPSSSQTVLPHATLPCVKYNTPCACDTLSFALQLFLFVTILSVVLARPSRYTSNAPFTWQLVVCVAALLCRYNRSSRYNSACVTTLPARDTLSFALQLSSFSLQSCLSFSLVPLAILVTLPSRDNLSFALQLFSVVTTFPLVTTLLVLQHSLRVTPCPLHCSSSFSWQSSLSFSLVPLAIN